MTHRSPIDTLVEQIRSRLHAGRRETSERAVQLHALVDAYLAATESDIAYQFAATHNLPRPPAPPTSPTAAAAALHEAVLALPELGKTRADTLVLPVAEPPVPPGPREPPPSTRSQSAAQLPHLEATEGAIVIVGGASRRGRLEGLPVTLGDRLEWIDTTRQGTHAIGNLERRIRERRVAALIVLEGVIAHKHSDPLVSAARRAALPFGYANKGGRASMLHAFLDIEKALEHR